MLGLKCSLWCSGVWFSGQSSEGPLYSLFWKTFGIEKRKNCGLLPFSANILKLLKNELPSDWVMNTHRLNLCDSGSAASRPRFFIVGASGRLRKTRFQRSLLDGPLRCIPAPPLLELLTPVAYPSHFEEQLTAKQQVNVLIYLDHFRK